MTLLLTGQIVPKKGIEHDRADYNRLYFALSARFMHGPF
jgi:hypothetical protein